MEDGFGKRKRDDDPVEGSSFIENEDKKAKMDEPQAIPDVSVLHVGNDEEESGSSRTESNAAWEASATRAIVITGLTEASTYEDVCFACNANGGAIEYVRLNGDQTAFVKFVSIESAKDMKRGDVMSRGTKLGIEFVGCEPLSQELQMSAEAGATRNLYISVNLNGISDELVRSTFEAYCPLDSVSLLREKNLVFVNMTDLGAAVRARAEQDGRQLAGQVMVIKHAKEGRKTRGVQRHEGSRPRRDFRGDGSSSRGGRGGFRDSPPSRFSSGRGGFQGADRRSPPGGYQGADRRSPLGGFARVDPRAAVPYSPYGSPVPIMMMGVPRQHPGGPPPDSAPGPGAVGPAAGYSQEQRAIYVGNLPADTSNHELISLANMFGALESASVVQAKSCGFINFIDGMSAVAMMQRHESKPLEMKGSILKVNWGKTANFHPSIRGALAAGATRNLYFGSVPDGVSQGDLQELCGPFGEIDMITVLPDKHIAFVNFCNISHAIKAKAHFEANPPELQGGALKVISFAKDGRPPKGSGGGKDANPSPMGSPRGPPQGNYHTYVAPAAPYPGEAWRNPYEQGQPHFAAPVSQPYGGPSGAPSGGPQNPYGGPPQPQYQGGAGGPWQQQAPLPLPGSLPPANTQDRSVYLGGLSEAVTYTDLCQLAARYGRLESLQLTNTGAAYLNFLHAQSAGSFLADCARSHLELWGRPVQVSGVPSQGPMSKDLLDWVEAGATRVVFLSGLPQTVQKDYLMQLVQPFGTPFEVQLRPEPPNGLMPVPTLCCQMQFPSLHSSITAKAHFDSVVIHGVKARTSFYKEL
jgi:hypothetical protein